MLWRRVFGEGSDTETMHLNCLFTSYISVSECDYNILLIFYSYIRHLENVGQIFMDFGNRTKFPGLSDPYYAS